MKARVKATGFCVLRIKVLSLCLMTEANVILPEKYVLLSSPITPSMLRYSELTGLTHETWLCVSEDNSPKRKSEK